jgi:hypothetical protein
MDFYIPEDGILHSHRRENLKYYICHGTCIKERPGLKQGFGANDNHHYKHKY